MGTIFVPGKKAGLPTDMEQPGYSWLSDGKDALKAVARYVTADEWKELAAGANAAQRKHQATSNPIVMGLFICSLAVIFCPLMCYTCIVDVEGKTNADIDMLAVTLRLKERGITVHYFPKTSKFDHGGMACTVSKDTPLVGEKADKM